TVCSATSFCRRSAPERYLIAARRARPHVGTAPFVYLAIGAESESRTLAGRTQGESPILQRHARACICSWYQRITLRPLCTSPKWLTAVDRRLHQGRDHG